MLGRAVLKTRTKEADQVTGDRTIAPVLVCLKAAFLTDELLPGVQQLGNVLKAFQVVAAPALGPAGASEAGGGLARVFQRLAREVSLKLGSGPTLPPVPVLLVDDMVDSGWTLTLATVLLRRRGSGPVYPFALAKASPRGS